MKNIKVKHLSYIIAGIIVPLLMLPISANAENNQSIMFDKPTPNFVKSTRSQDKEQQAKHCKELSRKVEVLKGKPQRRYVAAERYKNECTQARR